MVEGVTVVMAGVTAVGGGGGMWVTGVTAGVTAIGGGGGTWVRGDGGDGAAGGRCQ